MKWYWKVRLYRPDHHYYIGQIETERELFAIGILQDFYLQMTSCKMIIEGMSEEGFPNTPTIRYAFAGCWKGANE